MTKSLDWIEYAAREFEDHPRRWPTPGVMARQLDPATRNSRVLDLIDQRLVRLAEGDTTRLMIFCPPQEGKSQRVSRRFPAWLLAHDPTLRIAVVSFEQGKAERWGRQIRRDITNHPDLGITLAADSRSVARWETVQGGGLICVGIGGGITGEPVDVLIIDDPVRGRAEAESATYRQAAWDWWESNGSTRLSSRGRVVLMMTRWHTGDLAGLLETNEPGEWEVLSIPAIAGDTGDDPLGRAPGEEMPSVRDRPPGYFATLAKLRSRYVFESIYQQRPISAAGGIFKRDDWRYWTLITEQTSAHPVKWLHLGSDRFDLTDCRRFVTIDLAASTKTSADWTVAAAWAITLSGDLVLLDRVRARVPEIDHAEFVAPLRKKWLGPYDVTHVESRMLGTSLIYALGRAGVPVEELKPETDKLTRALPYAGLVRQHKVWLPDGAPWLDEWREEHAEFDRGSHDDQVDTGSYAANVLLTRWMAPEDAAQTMAAHVARAEAPVDLMTTGLGGW